MAEKPTSTMAVEQTAPVDVELSLTSSTVDASKIDRGNEAVLLDISAAGISSSRADVKLAPDGHLSRKTVLIPQPSDDPEDPLNWTWGKKHTILFIVTLSGFLCEFSAGVANPAIFLQGEEWGMTAHHVLYANNLFVAMMGTGAVCWIPTSYYWGRAPLLLWTNVAGTCFILGCALSTNFTMYYGFRGLQGFTLTCAQTIGVGIIKDMFFLHEQARKIGIYICIVLVAPSMGPQFANFMLAGLGVWRPAFWLSFAIGCFTILLMLFFYDETWYRREEGLQKTFRQSHWGRSRIYRLLGLAQVCKANRPYFLTVKHAYLRMLLTVVRPVVVPTMIISALTFMWAVGIVVISSIIFGTPVAEGGYGYGPNAVGYLFFIPLVGITLGERFGHWFNDWQARRYVLRHRGVFVPEARLLTGYIAGAIMIPALILCGCALQYHLNVAAIVFGWGAYTFGILVMAVALTNYLVDAYPLASAEIAGLLNFSRTISGFTVGYFQTPWGLRSGYALVFGVEAVLCAVGILGLFVLHMYGARVRAWGGPLTL